MASSVTESSIEELLHEHGTSYAAEAGITLRDKPSPLYQLLVLTTLLSVRIRADSAVAAARELFHAGWRTPAAMLDSTWQQRVDALGRGGYVRYDESTARYLEAGAQLAADRYHGDLRRMRAAADGDRARLRKLITEFPRIGETGAHIFCREAQAVWPELRPYFDQRAMVGAQRLDLPRDPARLARMVDGDQLAELAAALVRVSLAKQD
ncbi:MAG TPA: endonuclease [Pseudonocardiaceae bacterium]|nr:endonuclease [Pseudonocardiaceae bacterium]